jgi:amidophosphoribosyltransferase
LVAHDRSVEEIRAIIGCDALIYQDVEGMKKAVLKAASAGADGQIIKLAGFDASCFDGVYVTGDITAADIARMADGRSDGVEGEEDSSRLALPNPS